MDEDIGSRNDDRGPGFRSFTIVLFVIAVTAISLRFWSRSITPTHPKAPRFWWDDWLALLAPFILTFFVICFILVDLGFGRHIRTINPSALPTLLKLLFAAHFVWDVALYLCRESAIFFFRRVFPRDNSTRIFNFALYATHGLNTAWFVGIVIGAILRCRPVALNWNPDLPGKCNSLQGAWLGTAVPSLAIDLLILLLPMPTIWGLKTIKSRKLGLIIIFTLGYSVVVITIGRLITISIAGGELDDDVTYNSIPSLYWIAADTPLTLLSICLPAMVTLYNLTLKSYLSPLVTRVLSVFSPRAAGEPSSSSGGFPSSRHFKRIDHDAANSGLDKLYPLAPTALDEPYPMDGLGGVRGPLGSSQPYSVQVNAGQPGTVPSGHLPGPSIHVTREFKIHQ